MLLTIEPYLYSIVNFDFLIITIDYSVSSIHMKWNYQWDHIEIIVRRGQHSLSEFLRSLESWILFEEIYSRIIFLSQIIHNFHLPFSKCIYIYRRIPEYSCLVFIALEIANTNTYVNYSLNHEELFYFYNE